MKGSTVGLRCVTWLATIATHASAQQSTLVSVAGRQVEVVRMGEGSPTLVLESGGGESAAQWNRILPELAKQTRVISYSRAGFGKSGASTLPGSPQLSVSELHQLLQALGETGPVVIAGHSWGGLLARLYASTFPTEVVGLVLIDGTHEAQHARWEMQNPALKIADAIRAVASRAPPSLHDLLEQVLSVEAAQRVDGMKPTLIVHAVRFVLDLVRATVQLMRATAPRNGRLMACGLPLTRRAGWSFRPEFASVRG